MGKANAAFILGPTGQVNKKSLDGMEFPGKKNNRSQSLSSVSGWPTQVRT